MKVVKAGKLQSSQTRQDRARPLWKKIWRARWIYVMLLPAVVWMLIFDYGPMYGLLLAFKNYKAKAGILMSPWVGLAHFRRIFITPDAKRAIFNTVWISLGRLVFEFPCPIILAILVSEMRGTKLKKVYQTIFTFPHFISWVVASIILTNFLSSNGGVNVLLGTMGLGPVNFLGSKGIFIVLMFLTAIWKGVGWGSIVYMAALAGINPELYDAAKVDGANRLQRIRHITLPGIASCIAIHLILNVGGLMNAGFDQIFNMRNSVVSPAVSILDTYIYDITFGGVPNYGFSTAVGLFKAVINVILLLIANYLVGRISDGENKLISG